MKAISKNPGSGQRPASSDVVVFLHGHRLEGNLARAVTAEAAGTFVLVLAITSAAVAAALSRPVAGAPPVAGGLALAIARLGATVPAAGVSAGRVLAVETVVTFVLVLVVVAVATDTRVPRGVAAIAIGAALAVAIVISGPVSGAGVNPARAIGPMILAAQFSDWWAYLAAPIVGGVLAVALYDRFLRAGGTPA